jgi:hypothetical protein
MCNADTSPAWASVPAFGQHKCLYSLLLLMTTNRDKLVANHMASSPYERASRTYVPVTLTWVELLARVTEKC